MEQEPSNLEAWRLPSLAEECLLNYRGALEALRRVMDASKRRERRDLERLVLLEEEAARCAALPLAPDELDRLRLHLESILDEQPCDHTCGHARAWLKAHVPAKKVGRILGVLRNRGGFCDCEILHNAT